MNQLIVVRQLRHDGQRGEFAGWCSDGEVRIGTKFTAYRDRVAVRPVQYGAGRPVDLRVTRLTIFGHDLDCFSTGLSGGVYLEGTGWELLKESGVLETE